MKQITRFIACGLASLLIFSGTVFGSCGGGGGKHHRDHGGGSVGVGGSVDLGGVGRHTREPDPFGGADGSSVSKTQEKPKTKTKQTSVGFNPFDGIKLTGTEAKSIASTDSSASLPKQ